jgi:hypothetical protein
MSDKTRRFIRSMLHLAMQDDRRIASATEEVLRAVLMADVDEDFVDMSDADFEELLESMREARTLTRLWMVRGEER